MRRMPAGKSMKASYGRSSPATWPSQEPRVTDVMLPEVVVATSITSPHWPTTVRRVRYVMV